MRSNIFYKGEIEDLERKSSRGNQQFFEVNYNYDKEIQQIKRDFKSYRKSTKINGGTSSRSVMAFRNFERPVASFTKYANFEGSDINYT